MGIELNTIAILMQIPHTKVMENQPITNSSDVSATNPITVSQPPVQPQTKTNLIMPFLVTFLVSATLFGFGGYYLGKQSSVNQPQNLLNQNQTEVTPSVSSSPTSVVTSPAPDLTANWKVYTNSTLGFTVKYPETWNLVKCGPGDAALLSPTTVPQCASEPYEPIQFFADNKVQSESEFIVSLGTGFKLTPKADLVTIGIPHQKYLVEKVQPAPGPDSFIEIRVPRDNGSFKIYVFDTQQEKIADQILSTIKFQ